MVFSSFSSTLEFSAATFAGLLLLLRLTGGLRV